MFNGDCNSYANNSGNSYTYTYVTNNFDHSFNATNSHNGHGRGGICGLLVLLGAVGLPLAALWLLLTFVAEALT